MSQTELQLPEVAEFGFLVLFLLPLAAELDANANFSAPAVIVTRESWTSLGSKVVVD